ncbi:GNAT family N-acetyltransferase [Marininema halotolerans]|uniref:GNAT family N-acetyltransferase n=1 Tax=Marininema halotolerans TaxID=1155944 RepID=UPI000B8608F2
MGKRHIAPFWKLNVPLEEFEAYLTKSVANPYRDHFMIYSSSTPIGYMMRYQVAHDMIRDY